MITLVTSTKNNNKVRLREDTVFYQLGKMAFIPFILIGIWFAYTGYAQYGELFACAFKKMCGLPCPGCGGTRALYYLFRGNIIKSIQFNPTVLYGVLAYLHFMLLYFYRKHISKTLQDKKIQIQNYLYGAVAVVLVQWITKIVIILLSV